MASDFDRALDAARRRERDTADSQAQLTAWAIQAAKQGYHQMLEIGRQAFDTLARAGCEEFTLVEDSRTFKRADNVGIEIGYDHDGESYTYLHVCRDGRFHAGSRRLEQITSNERWFSNEPKDRRIDGRRILSIHRSDWVCVSVRDGWAMPALAYFPSSMSASCSVFRRSSSEELLTSGFGGYYDRPFVEDIATRVANILKAG